MHENKKEQKQGLQLLGELTLAKFLKNVYSEIACAVDSIGNGARIGKKIAAVSIPNPMPAMISKPIACPRGESRCSVVNRPVPMTANDHASQICGQYCPDFAIVSPTMSADGAMLKAMPNRSTPDPMGMLAFACGHTVGLFEARVGPAPRHRHLHARRHGGLPIEGDLADRDRIARVRAELLKLLLDTQARQTVRQIADGLVIVERRLVHPPLRTRAAHQYGSGG